MGNCSLPLLDSSLKTAMLAFLLNANLKDTLSNVKLKKWLSPNHASLFRRNHAG